MSKILRHTSYVHLVCMVMKAWLPVHLLHQRHSCCFSFVFRFGMFDHPFNKKAVLFVPFWISFEYIINIYKYLDIYRYL